MTDTAGPLSTAAGAGSAAKTAATETAHAFLDLFLGILLPIALLFSGFLMAKSIGGFVSFGNMYWGLIGGGSGITGALSGPATGTLASVSLLAIYGGITLLFWRLSHTDGKFAKYIFRAIAAFFGGLSIFAAQAGIQQAMGTPGATTFGSGGVLDTFFANSQPTLRNLLGVQQ